VAGSISALIRPQGNLLKKPFLVSAVLALTLASACGGGSGVAARVNGTEITVEQVEGMQTMEEGATIALTDFARALTNAIVEAVVFDAAREQFGIDPADGDIEVRYQEMKGQVEAGGMTLEQFLEERRLPEPQFRRIARQQLVREGLIDHFRSESEPVSDEIAQQTLDQEFSQRVVVCASHILVATEEEALDIKDRLDSGEDFGTIAASTSLDTSSGAQGGGLGCQSPAAYVPEFAQATMEAEIGTITDPVQTNFGFHLILVEERITPTLDDVKEDLERAGAEDLTNAWLVEVVSAAEVEVEERYGQWVTEPIPQILPPQG
jgi:parvulin-like peptidyl-prolyl isomerase